MGIIAELKRRKVVRTTLAYVAAAFVTAQGVQLLVDGLDLPSWILTATLIFLLAGLPLVIGLAWAFDLTAEGVERTPGESAASHSAFSWRSAAIPAVASVLIGLAAVAFIARADRATTLDQNLVAVLPFRVSGDPQIEYLREGMVDMLAAKLTGEGGPRAADPRVVGNAVRQHGDGDSEVAEADAAEIAGNIGAGQVLIGTVVGTPAQFTVHAKLLRVPDGQVLVQAEQAGNANSLLTTVDQLVARLLSLKAGEGPQQLAVLTTTSLAALRAYLDGRLEYRNGYFGKARERFASALDVDSTFALAAIGLWMTASWGEGPPTDAQRTFRIIANHRERLGAVDRAMADAIVGKDWPRPRSQKERIAAWEEVTRIAPDRPDAWFWYADLMHHWGPVADYTDATEQSDVLFGRVLQLDSAYMPALMHRIDNAIRNERLDTLARLEAIRKARDPDGTAAIYQHSYRIRLLRDSAAIRAEMSALDTLALPRLLRISWSIGVASGSAADAVRAIDAALKRSVPTAERRDVVDAALGVYLVLGMPSRAKQSLDELLRLDTARFSLRTYQVLATLYFDADTAAGRAAVREIETLLPNETRLRARVRATCALGHWRLLHDEFDRYRAAAAALSQVPADSLLMKNEASICIHTLAALYAAGREPATLREHVSTLNAALKDGAPQDATFRNASNIVLSRTAERAGDQALAHRAVSRLAIVGGAMEFWPPMMREQARLAALIGKREEAIRLYRMYLTAHEEAEPAIRQKDDAIRAHLAQLSGERR